MRARRQPIANGQRSRQEEENDDAQPVPDRGARPALHGARADHRAGAPGVKSRGRACDDPRTGAGRTAGHAADRRSHHAARADRARRPRGGPCPGHGAAQLDAVQRLAERAARDRPGDSGPGRGGWLRHASVGFKVAAAAVAILVLPLACPARADTVLRLSETATVSVPPDELATTLRAEAAAPTAAEAQQRINARMADALARVRQTPGIDASTGAYNVWRSGPNPKERNEGWQASQTLELHAHDGAALLSLVGELQQKQLAVGELAWQLAPETARRARQEAMTAAVKALRSRAEDAAALIGLQFNSFKEVRSITPGRRSCRANPRQRRWPQPLPSHQAPRRKT